MKIALGLAIVAALIYVAGAGEIFSSLAEFDAVLLVPVFLLFVAALALGALNVKILLDAKLKAGFREFFPGYCLSWAAGSLLPGKIGDFSLGYIMRGKIGIGEMTAIVLLDKIITLFLLSVLASVGVFLFAGEEIAGFVSAGLVLAWLGLAAFFIFFGGAKILEKLAPKKYAGGIRDFFATLKYFIAKERKRVALNSAVTVLKLVVQSAAFTLIFWGMGVYPNPVDIMLITSAATIISFVPLTASGLGIKEGAFAYLALQIGIPLSKSVANAAVSTALNYALVALALLAFLKKRPE